jgi:hypothetical protein
LCWQLFYECRINIAPVTQPHRRIPFQLRKKVEDELKRLEELDIIERVDGPTPWVSPIVWINFSFCIVELWLRFEF